MVVILTIVIAYNSIDVIVQINKRNVFEIMSYELKEKFLMFVRDFADTRIYPTREEFWKLVEEAKQLREEELAEAGL